MEGPEKKSGSGVRAVGVAVALSAQLVFAIVMGFLLGRWLDNVLHTGPWLTIVGVLVGIGAGFLGLFRLSRVLSR